MTELTKEDLFFERDENGELIGQDVKLELLEGKPTVRVKPLPRGMMQRIRLKALSGDIEEKVESDCDLIRGGLVKPKLTDQQIKDMKPQKANAIIVAIMSVSLDAPQTEVNKTVDKLVDKQEAELKKKV
jgi:hypothetical protein